MIALSATWYLRRRRSEERNCLLRLHHYLPQVHCLLQHDCHPSRTIITKNGRRYKGKVWAGDVHALLSCNLIIPAHQGGEPSTCLKVPYAPIWFCQAERSLYDHCLKRRLLMSEKIFYAIRSARDFIKETAHQKAERTRLEFIITSDICVTSLLGKSRAYWYPYWPYQSDLVPDSEVRPDLNVLHA